MEKLMHIKSVGQDIFLSYKEIHIPVSMHLHDYYELEIVLAGHGEQNLNGTVYPIGPGCVYFLTPIDFHAITPHGPMRIAHMAVSEAMVSAQMRMLFLNRRGNYLFSHDSGFTETLQTLFELLLRETQKSDAYTAPMGKHILELMLLTLARAADSAPQSQVFSAPDQFHRALQYLFCHFREEVTLSSVARESGYSPNYFSALFHTITGERFVDFLAKLRLNYARMLLRSTDLPIARISEKSGFSSVASFHRRFQCAYGCAPGKNRRML